MYLWRDQVTKHEETVSQHQHFHVVTSHLGILLSINVVNVMEVGRILRGQGEH